MDKQSRIESMSLEDAAVALEVIREKIDGIDAALLDLLNQRAGCSLEVGRIKELTAMPIFRPDRERSLLNALVAANPGPLPNEHLLACYRQILASSRALQRPLRVVCLGPEGTFSYMAGLEYFGDTPEFTPVSSLQDVFSAVENKTCDFGIVPLENSLHGTVGQSVDLFAMHEVYIQAEWFSRIRLCLMSSALSRDEVTVVYSHAQPLGQCAGWLHQYLPHARQASVASTATAAQLATQEPHAAAIGHKGLAEKHRLTVLAESIEDDSDNWTRFCAIAAAPLQHAEVDKTSILFSLADKPGSLASVLQLFAGAGINLNKLESRPMRSERWKYIFFADLSTDLRLPQYAELLAEVRSHCHSFRCLGYYLRGEQVEPV